MAVINLTYKITGSGTFSNMKSLSELIRLLLLYLWSGKVRGRGVLAKGSPHAMSQLT